VSDPELADLSRSIRGSVLVEPGQVDRFQRDASHLMGGARAVVRPEDPADVEDLVRWSRRTKIPLVARGAGSSLEGESVPARGSIVVDLSSWTQILGIDRPNRLVRVQPGVVNYELHQTLSGSGLFFPPNPGSWKMSTIGGNASTNASGPRSLRYGPTRQWVRSAEVVLGTGDRIPVGHRSPKRSAGPELLDWLIGSEGTLGLFTELTLRLAVAPAARSGLVVPLPEGLRLGEWSQRLLARSDLVISALEFIDRASAHELARRAGSRLPVDRDLALLEIESGIDRRDADLERSLEALRSLGISEDPFVFPNADQLWTLRGESSVALDQAIGHRVREDVAVPVDRIDELLGSIRDLAIQENVPVYVFGHLGEGNFHPNYAVDPASAAADRIRGRLYERAHQLGGTLSAEHGIGTLKAPYLATEHGPVAVGLLWAVKRLFDPDQILNPGKLYPSGPSSVPTAPPPGSSPSGEVGDRTPGA
jgi:glycolate oxidase